MKPGYVVDADGHVFETEEGMRRFLPEPWKRRRPLFPPADTFNRDYFGTLGKIPRPTDPQTQLQDMDADGVDLAILYPSLGLGFGEIREPEWAAVYARAYNDWLADFCSANPQRLKGVPLVPLQDTRLACEELNRALGTLGLVGVLMPSYFGYGPRNLGEPALDEFYAEAQRLGVPVAIHASGTYTADRDRFRTLVQTHLLSHVPEQMTAVVAVAIGGVWERFPDLKVGFMEAGCGWLPFWLDHMDGEFERRHKEVPWLKHKPSEYIKHCQAYFGVEPEERLIPLVAQEIGAHKLLFASDYPHWDSDWPDTVRTLSERADVSDEMRQRIMCDNALDFYGLRAAVLT